MTDRQAPAGQTGTRAKERIYLGGLELYREYQADGVTVKLARETLHRLRRPEPRRARRDAHAGHR